MPKWLDKLLGADDPRTARGHRALAAKLNGRAIKYVTERPYSPEDGEESGSSYSTPDEVIGKSGSLTVKDGELIVLSSADIVFRGKVDELSLSELMSLEGVIITGKDEEHGGKTRKIIAYYTYYLKS